MKNSEVAAVFEDIACLLGEKDNPFKMRAYKKAASSIEGLSVEIEALVAEGRLREVPGVGETIAKRVTELVTTGRLGYYEGLKGEIADGERSADSD